MGSKVEYTCAEGFFLIGHSTLECTADKTWSARPGLCTSECRTHETIIVMMIFRVTLLNSDFSPVSRCTIGSLADDLIASPLKQAYTIGETVTLSCPEGRQLLGEATIICDASLNFSPDPTNIKCSPGKFYFNVLINTL